LSYTILYGSYEDPILGLGMLLILIFALILYVVVKRRTLRANALAAKGEGDSQFRSLAEAIPLIVWTAGTDGLTNYINQRWYEMTGTAKGECLGNSWAEFVHPDDLAVCWQKWNDCIHSGETFEIEYRLRDKDNRYRWFINRAVPLRDASGAIKQWFGSCTDIDDQMRNQQVLEEQIKERTGELFDANTKLKEEMWEKDLARKQLEQQNEQMMRDLTERSTSATVLSKLGEV
jgi:PAS domain S-box-containing protein